MLPCEYGKSGGTLAFCCPFNQCNTACHFHSEYSVWLDTIGPDSCRSCPHDSAIKNCTPTLPPEELWYSFKTAIIERLTSSNCYEGMLWEWISVPRVLGPLPSLKVTEILQILHDRKEGWTQHREEELGDPKLNAVKASVTLPLLPQSNRSAWLSTFLQLPVGMYRKREDWRQGIKTLSNTALSKPHFPDTNYRSDD